MKENNIINKLSGAARWDLPPAVNVADAVMREIGAAAPRSFDPIVGYFAVGAAIAAVIVAAVAIETWLYTQDPILDAMNSMITVIQ